MALPATPERVPRHTSEETNRKIAREAEERVRYYAAHPEQIDRRLRELDGEWDVERTLEANAATVSLIGLGLGAGVDRRFYALPAAVAGFLLQHALQGWCPPVPVLRRLGFRAQREIDAERTALKAIRGDFQNLQPMTSTHEAAAGQALAAAER